MGSLPSQRQPLSGLAALKAKKQPPKMLTKMVPVASTAKPTPKLSASAPTSSRSPTMRGASSNGISRKGSVPRKSLTPASTHSRQGSREPLERIRHEKHSRVKRASPAISTPQFTSSDEESEEEDMPRKRMRRDEQDPVDEKRKVRDLQAFSEDGRNRRSMIHAIQIANPQPDQHGKVKYEEFFKTLRVDEDEYPVIELQYPTALQGEKYQLLRPIDSSDFKPLDEIEANMRMVAEYYLDVASARKVNNEEEGSGFVQMLHRHAAHGLRGRVGAQSEYIKTIEKYNSLMKEKRDDGTIAEKLDQMNRVELKLAEHIIRGQVYARTVSPKVDSVRQYEAFSNSVYGELLPKFLSRIFKDTGLKSEHVFVDLGSGVGNCVVQAALETGCEAWGCEYMDNPNKLAQLQATEFRARCQLWGIKPGDVQLIHGDFLKNDMIRQVLKRADVVLVNNQAFSAQLNDNLKYVFLDLKEGCQIISLKPFRSPSHKIKESNHNDPINVLSVVEKERWSGMVSWTDDPGKWYHQRKDRRELDAFLKTMGGSD
ncbi:uncharacterized protein PV06_07413 [Exophiala oligosperma]|uniref:Histone-lysine N-methyltransferase, H3 lysine-79 specific n=1 Tax=Exophiala oligosperma TaxID=215243 RepID=A0A0D2DCK9_9EURO|nr:uncharacterized protein PV06_07413 [Exophiala oligosperma]KIW40195.1 hypothetical protein PV06_07413 [Exophiala oligosperma]